MQRSSAGRGHKFSQRRDPSCCTCNQRSNEIDAALHALLAAQTRRASLASIAGAAALLSGVAPSMAAYGDSANVFGRVTNQTGFVPYVGEGFALNLPSKWNPSKEQDAPGTVLRQVGDRRGQDRAAEVHAQRDLSLLSRSAMAYAQVRGQLRCREQLPGVRHPH